MLMLKMNPTNGGICGPKRGGRQVLNFEKVLFFFVREKQALPMPSLKYWPAFVTTMKLFLDLAILSWLYL